MRSNLQVFRSMEERAGTDPHHGNGLVPQLVGRFMGAVREASIPAITSLLLVFLFLRAGIVPLGNLPAEVYGQPFIAWEAVKALPGFGLRILPWLGVVAVFFWKWRLLMKGWHEWEHGSSIRILVIACSVVLVWPHATYDYNPYFEQWHAMDRIFLFVGFIGICWRPVFVLPFLVILVPVIGQFNHPIGGLSWAPPDQAIHLLILFSGYFLVSLVTGSKRGSTFFYLAASLIAIHYWPSGYSKLRSGWLLENDIEFLMPNTYANGWLASFSKEQIEDWAKVLATLNPYLKTLTLLAECGTVFFFLHRRIAIFLTGIWIFMHLGIFMVSGICFWSWIVVDASLLFLIWQKKIFSRRISFGGLRFVFAFLLIVTSHRWLGPVSLTWFDAPATYTYRFYGTGQSGKEYHLQPRYFQPYDYQFTLGGFRYLSDETRLPITWGAASKPVAEVMKGADSVEDLLALESELGGSSFNAQRRDRLEKFLRKFVAGVNKSADRKTALRSIQPPRLLWTYGEDTAYRFEEPIKRVKVVEVLSFFDGNTYQEVRRKPLLDVKIPIEPVIEEGIPR